MIHEIPAALAPAAACSFAEVTRSTTKRSLRRVGLVWLLLAGCLGSSAGPSLAAGDEKASPKSDRAIATTPATGSAAAAAGAVSSNPVVLQRRRQAIAQLLEGSLAFRTLFDVKLINSKLAGPFPYKVRNALFSSETHTETLYCAKADFDIPWIHAIGKIAVIRVGEFRNNSERLYVTIPKYYPFECRKADYGPFPELEQARARRRHALGKSD
jgi:hypothetical protein